MTGGLSIQADRPRTGLTLRGFLLLLVACGVGYVAVIALVVSLGIAPTATVLRQHSSRVLAAHDQIRLRLDVLSASIGRVHHVILKSRAAPASITADTLQSIIGPTRARLDSVAAQRYAESLEGVPADMRMDLANAGQAEGELGIALLAALQEVQLRRPDSALARLRTADDWRGRTEALLQSAQRSALVDMVMRESRLGDTAAFAGRAVFWWLAIGIGIVPLLAIFVRRRIHQPLTELEACLARIAGGDLDVSVVTQRDDEIGRLGKHLNSMTAVLRTRADDERRTHENLSERLGHLFNEGANEILVFESGSFGIVQASRGALAHLCYDLEQIRAMTPLELMPAHDAGRFTRLLDELRSRAQTQVNLETRLKCGNGRSYPVAMNLQLSFAENPPVFLAVVQDITERREADRLRTALGEFSLSRRPVTSTRDVESLLQEITSVTARALRVERVGIRRLDRGVLRTADLYALSRGRHETGLELATASCPHYLRALRTHRIIASDRAPADSRLTELTAQMERSGVGAAMHAPLRVGGELAGAMFIENVGPARPWSAEEQDFAATMADFAAQILEGAERHKLQDQLTESQRLESVGQLAGGVAHDFNNLLTAVLSYSELAASSLVEGHPAIEDLEAIQQAAHRAADLTRQLLLFARRQVVTPRVVDLNRLTIGMDKLLRRLIGEDVELVTILGPELGSARVDPTHFEQVIVNLAVNARDAMPSGGKLTIATSTVTLDGDHVRRHPDATAGQFVALTISDTGTGMDETTRARIFEPFFTTKERGKGTGLGLATAYGIIRQAGGHIQVASELGVGTVFTVYLPVVDEAPADLGLAAHSTPAPSGQETILLAEDEPQIRDVLARGLRLQGYTLLIARNGAEALETARRHTGPIHLLVTDVVMPLLNGRDLARELSVERPGTPTLFMSGYAEATVVHGGVVEPGITFLPKPFTAADLSRHVRAILDAPNATN